MIIKQGKPVLKVYRGEKLVDSIHRGENLLFGGSPYNPEATAALKEAFPEQWETIKEYGRMHTEIVPYVNKNPLCAAIWCCYVQDGLAFQMDCNYECTEAKWKDVRSAIEFNGTNVQIVDDVPTFNGSAYYMAGQAYSWNVNTHTIEVIYTPNAQSGHIMCNGNGSIGASFFSNGLIMCYNGDYKPMPPQSPNGELSVLSYCIDRMYRNGYEISSVGTNYWSAVGSKSYIGSRNGGDFFNGKVYGIRIYNRKLTETEILANQDIDMKRWR